MDLVNIKIDGIEISVPKNTTVLEAAKKINKLIPTFCYHEKLPVFGGCRMCLVYDVKAKRSIIACGSYVYDGMEIETENEKVKEDRKFILEMLFTRHPLDCPICDKAGECDLQNWGTYWGPQHNILSITPFEKIRPEEDWESDYLEYVSNRCVLCMKCVSVCDNINKSHSITQIERGFEILISPALKPMDTSTCEMCGLCVDICPVGAILFKPFKFNARAWLLKETYTHCSFCSLGCPVVIDHDDKKIHGIRSTAELEVCVKPYLGYDSFNTNRLKYPKINNDYSSFDDALQEVIDLLNEKPSQTAIVVSPYLSNENLQKINEITSKSGAYITSTITLDLLPLLEGFGEYTPPSEEELKNAKKWIVVGNDITDTNPVITYYMNKKVIAISSQVERLKKLYPLIIDAEGEQIIEKLIENVDGSEIVVYSNYFYGEDAYRFGKKLKEVQSKVQSKILLIPPYPNGFGIINIVENLSYLPDIISKIESGEIKNIIFFGEDIAEFLEEDKLKEILMILEKKVIFTPFEDGLALVCDVAIPLNTWTEEDGHYSFVRGIRKVKTSIKSNINNNKTFEKILNQLKSGSKQNIAKSSYRKLPAYFNIEKQNIWDVSFFSRRSNNLTGWKMKNFSMVEED
jgi:NADH-quinone oxidoreductase subunit G